MAGYNADGSRRIARAVRRIEKTPRSPVRRPAGPRISTTGKYAIVATAIGAANRGASTLGKGTGTLQIVSYDASDVATYASMNLGFDVPIYSGDLTGIAAGRLVQLKVIDGRYHVDVDYC